MNSLGFDKKEKDTKIIVAMSGGVDSSVAAVKLKKEGYNIIGVTLRLYNQPNSAKSKSCCAGIDIEDASNVAKQYDFPHKVFDYQDKFFNGVINNFVTLMQMEKLLFLVYSAIKLLNFQIYCRSQKN